MCVNGWEIVEEGQKGGEGGRVLGNGKRVAAQKTQLVKWYRLHSLPAT